MAYSYPLQLSNDRSYDQAFDGHVLIWDIDKTYLNTHFSSWRGLLAIPFEFAVDKEALPGAVPLLQALRHGPDPEPRLTPLYFVSASPPQLRPIIQRKMTMDGVDFDGIAFKDQVTLLRRRQLRKLRDQSGYKLSALLLYRAALPEHARFVLFGDDVEHDAELFSLFAEICAGLRADPLHRRLRKRGTAAEDADYVCQLADEVLRQDAVERVYIHLTRHTPVEHFDRFEGQVVATEGFFEQALHLAQSGLIRAEGAQRVTRSLIHGGVEPAELQERLERAARRFELSDQVVDPVRRSILDV